MAQVDSFFRYAMSKKAALPMPLLGLVFWEDAISKKVTLPTLVQTQSQTTNAAVFLPGMQCCRLVDFLWRCGIKGTSPMPPAMGLPNHQCRKLSVFLAWHRGSKTTPQVACFLREAASKEETLPTLLQTRNQTTNPAGGLFILDMASKEARNAAG